MNKLIYKSHLLKSNYIKQTKVQLNGFIINQIKRYYVSDNSGVSSTTSNGSIDDNEIIKNRTEFIDDVEPQWKETKSKKVKKCVLTGQDRIPKSVKDISFLNKHGLLVKLNSGIDKNNSNNVGNKKEDENGEEITREEYNDTFEVIKSKKQKQLQKELIQNNNGDQIIFNDDDDINVIKKTNKKKKKDKETINIVGSGDMDEISIESDEVIYNVIGGKKSKKKSNKQEKELNNEELVSIDKDEMLREYNLDENGEHIVTMSPGFEISDLNKIKSNLEKPLKESKKKKIRQPKDIEGDEKEEVKKVKEKKLEKEKLEKLEKEEEKKEKKKKKVMENENQELNNINLIDIDKLKNKKLKKEKVNEYLNIKDVYKEWKENVLLKVDNIKQVLNSRSIKLPNHSIQTNQINLEDSLLEKSHEWDQLVESCNKQVFGNESFRELQKQIINSILHKRDTFVSLPTGGGKSLCFQIPSIVDQYDQGISFVVSPLLSLMQDQVHKLKLLGITACSINSSNTISQNRKNVEEMLNKEKCQLTIVYISPERLTKPEFLNVLSQLYQENRIKRLIVDEAHCISEWGHDFRPAYRKVSIFRENFPNVPIAAFTATAKPSVENDIKNQLMLQNPITISSSFLRTNLLYQIRLKSGDQSRSFYDISEYIKNKQSNSCGIIYCATTNDCETLSQFLNEQNIDSHFYHGSLKTNERIEIQKAWTNKSFKIIVTTLAFGMGIDVKDVRFIIHFTMPSSIEAYYQQTGRAGRDGKKSECILYYSSNDYFKISRIIQSQSSTSNSYYQSQDEMEYGEYDHLKNQKQQMDNNKIELLDSINSFCRNDTTCRRVQLLDYFGEVSKPCKTNCDICISNQQNHGNYNSFTKSKFKQLKDDIKSSNDSIERVYTRNSYSTFHLNNKKLNKKKSNRNISNEDYDHLD